MHKFQIHILADSVKIWFGSGKGNKKERPVRVSLDSVLDSLAELALVESMSRTQQHLPMFTLYIFYLCNVQRVKCKTRPASRLALAGWRKSRTRRAKLNLQLHCDNCVGNYFLCAAGMICVNRREPMATQNVVLHFSLCSCENISNSKLNDSENFIFTIYKNLVFWCGKALIIATSISYFF